MRAIKLLALDLDGTLLNSDKEISERNKRALKAARDRGVKVVLTTGRPLAAIGDFLEALDLISPEDYAITFNGGLIQRNTGEILQRIVFGYDEARALYDLTQKLGLPLDLLDDGDVYSLEAAVASLYPTCNPNLNHMATIFENLSSDMTFNKAVTCCEAELIDSLLGEIPADYHQDFEIFKSRPIILEWCPQDVHKANGLDGLTQLLGIEASEVMACGDEANDLSMVQWAGYGVAMANATDELKAVADIVTPMTNDEDAIAWLIDNYILN